MDAWVEETTSTDESVIEAVLSGKRERYEELVNRYADKIYAVAWSRLGDRDLAEEVVQESFILGYQRLNQLKDAEKFLPWITTIARHKSIQYGLKNRRELQHRERWALEHALYEKPGEEGDAKELVSAETLQSSLASMKDSYRESLSLYYLEGKSLEASARTLGITANNFKTRLHRARMALKGQLEKHLGPCLKQLKSSQAARHAIMAAVMTQGPGSTGAKAITASVLSMPGFKWFFLDLLFLTFLPLTLVWKWNAHSDFKNFRDPEDYLAKKHQPRKSIWVVIFFATAFILFWRLMSGAPALLFIKGFWCFICLSTLISYAQQDPVMRQKSQLFSLMAVWLIFLGLTGYFLWGWPQAIFFFSHAIFINFNYFLPDNAPLEKDDSVFSRIATEDPPNISNANTALKSKNPHDLAQFISFLISERDAVNARRSESGFWVQTKPICNHLINAIFTAFLQRRTSVIFFGYDGRVQSMVGENDLKTLLSNHRRRQETINEEALNSAVEECFQSAFMHWKNGDLHAARLAIGRQQNSELIDTSLATPARIRIRKRVRAGAAIVLVSLGIFQYWIDAYGPELELRSMKEISLKESDVRRFLSLLNRSNESGKKARESFERLINFSHSFPPKYLYPKDSLQEIQRDLIIPFENHMGRYSPQGPKEISAAAYLDCYERSYMDFMDLFDLDFLPTMDWQKETQTNKDAWTELEYYVSDEGWDKMWPEKLLIRLNRLSKYIDLKQLDFTEANQIIAKHQYLDTTKDVDGRYRAKAISDLHGLFLNSNEPFKETWEALSILEKTGGLNLINKQACIDGILRHHYGKGGFIIVRTEGRFNREQWRRPTSNSGARDTWFAFHSLRILDALDQVKDLASWEFRLRKRSKRIVDTPAGEWPYSGVEIEAWCMQREFQQFMQSDQ